MICGHTGHRSLKHQLVGRALRTVGGLPIDPRVKAFCAVTRLAGTANPSLFLL
jgi:hypothetical protein